MSSWKNDIFKTQIPRAIRAAESTRYGESIIAHDKNSKVAQSYVSFAKEVIDDERKEKTRNSNSVRTR